MNTPQLNRRLVLEEQVRTPDGAGGFDVVWTPLGNHWAEVRAGRGREKAAEFVMVSSLPYQIIVRAAPYSAPSRPKPDQRFKEGSRIFRIQAVSENDPQEHYLICHCKEEVPS